MIKQRWSRRLGRCARVLWVMLVAEPAEEAGAVRRPAYPRRGLGGTFLDTGGMSTMCLSLICAIVVEEQTRS